LAARKQVDRCVALAGGLCLHLHARIENFLSGKEQARVSATEQGGKELAEIDVDGIESQLQKLARLAVDLPDRAFEGGQSLGEILRLRIEIGFAFRRLLELIQRGEVDRAQHRDRLCQALD